jgi:hypothetical protein
MQKIYVIRFTRNGERYPGFTYSNLIATIIAQTEIEAIDELKSTEKDITITDTIEKTSHVMSLRGA